MAQNITKNIVENILKIYEKICSIKSEDFNKLISIKNSYYDLYKTCKKYNQLATSDGNDYIDFLERNLSSNFVEEAIKIERTLYLKISEIFINYSIDKKLKDYYLSRFLYSLSKFNIVYNNLDISKGELKKLKNKITESKKILPVAERIPNDFKKALILSLNQKMGLYKNTIIKEFYEIKELLKWYDKDIRIYFSSRFNDIIIYAYNSSKNSIHIYPKKITVLPSLDLNIEEINKRTCFSLRTIFPRKDLNKDDYLKSIESSPLKEVINLFWKSASRDEQLEFLTYIYELLGFKLENSYDKEFFYLIKTKYENINIKNINDDSERILFFPINNYFNSSDLDKIIHSISTKNIVKKNTFLTLFSVNNFNLKNKKSIIENISLITLDNIIYILDKLKIKNLFNQYLKKKILEKNSSKLKLIVKKEIIGEKLLRNLADFNLENGTWKEFEELGENIFDFLFKDSFKTYSKRRQYSDYQGHRRYDLLIVNITSKIDFWKSCKNEYNSKIIIIDFKNYSKDIDQDTIHMFSKYLNKKNGNFGIIISKSGISKSGKNEQKIKYTEEDKLIIHLSSEDLYKMIHYKINNQSPEDILDAKHIDICIP